MSQQPGPSCFSASQYGGGICAEFRSVITLTDSAVTNCVARGNSSIVRAAWTGLTCFFLWKSQVAGEGKGRLSMH
eukprot:6197520-Pleurochrysis_carterae.AAC.3